jgi:ABC-type uncharacterized transport system ATPase subunit
MPEILRMSQIVKVYPNGMVANDHADLSVDGERFTPLSGRTARARRR